MKHVFIPGEGDEEQFSNKESYFTKLSDQELIECYQTQARCGITGVHAQAVYLLALRKVMIGRFGDSPIAFEEGGVLSLEGPLPE